MRHLRDGHHLLRGSMRRDLHAELWNESVWQRWLRWLVRHLRFRHVVLGGPLRVHAALRKQSVRQ